MKITELKIAPKRTWDTVSNDNPLVCTVKLESAFQTTTVETTLHKDKMRQIMELVQSTVSEAATRNVAAFASKVTAIEAQKEIKE